MTRRGERARTLRQAAATLFCLLAVVPLLVFVWTLYRLDVLREPEAQIGLALSLTLAVLGFVVLRRLMGEISAVMQLLTTSAARVNPAGTPSPAPRAMASGRTAPISASAGILRPNDGASRRARSLTPALGTIQELADMTAAVSTLWRREAEGQVGRPVKVDVINSTMPVSGTLVEVTEDGLLLERDGERIGVVWRRIAAVEPAEPALS